MPKIVATFLQIEFPEKYTGHAWRRSGATWLGDDGTDVINIQRAGGWASRSASEGYIAESKITKNAIANSISISTLKKVKHIKSKEKNKNKNKIEKNLNHLFSFSDCNVNIKSINIKKKN